MRGLNLVEATPADAQDHFSFLPDCIIHVILLYLSVHSLADAVRTRTLSKRWKNLWSTLPYFDSFLCPTFNLFVEKLKAKHPFSDIDVRQEYLNFLESFMTNRLENITSVVSLGLHMDFPNIEALSPLMDQWVHMAVQKHVSQLSFSSCVNDPSFILYTVPQVVFLSSTLTSLKLWDINLENMPEIYLPRLRDLDCCRVSGLDVGMVQKLVRHATQRLNIVSCDQLGKIVLIERVPSLQQVAFLMCKGLQIIEIHGPKLQEFSFSLALNNKSDLAELKLDACTSLRALRLSFATLWFQSVKSLLSTLEALELRACYSMISFIIPIKNLKELYLKNCTNISVPGIDLNHVEFPLLPPLATTCIHPLQIQVQFPLGNRDIIWWSTFKRTLINSFNTLKFSLHCPNSFTIIHSNLSDVSLDSLFFHNFASKGLVMCISSRSYSYIVDDLMFDNYSTTLSVVCPYEEPIEVLF